MKILFLIAELCSRGAEHQMVTLARLLKADGHDVSFLCYYTNNFFEHILIDQGIPVQWLPSMGCIKRMIKIRNIIRNSNYNAVVSFLITDNFLNNFAAIGGHSWKVVTGERSSKESLLTSRKGRIFAWFQRYADNIVCNSENARKMWIKHYPQYESKLLVIYNTVQIPKLENTHELRKDGKTHIIIAGAYAYVKDPYSLIHAVSLLSKEQQNKIIVDWYGKIGTNREADRIYKVCQKLIEVYGLEETFILHDATIQIADRMNEADVVALISRWEGLPNSICEGMAIGKPVIMTRISDYTVLIDERNGWICTSGFPDSIARVLIEIINTSDENLIARGEASKEKARHLFLDKKILKDWLNLLK